MEDVVRKRSSKGDFYVRIFEYNLQLKLDIQFAQWKNENL